METNGSRRCMFLPTYHTHPSFLSTPMAPHCLALLYTTRDTQTWWYTKIRWAPLIWSRMTMRGSPTFVQTPIRELKVEDRSGALPNTRFLERCCVMWWQLSILFLYRKVLLPPHHSGGDYCSSVIRHRSDCLRAVSVRRNTVCGNWPGYVWHSALRWAPVCTKLCTIGMEMKEYN